MVCCVTSTVDSEFIVDHRRAWSTTNQRQNLHFAFLELCARPEYAEMIYAEIQSVGELNYENINRLKILDSFVKESVRINPLDKSEQIPYSEIA